MMCFCVGDYGGDDYDVNDGVYDKYACLIIGFTASARLVCMSPLLKTPHSHTHTFLIWKLQGHACLG